MTEAAGHSDGEVTVVGTAHVTAESAERVRERLSELRPDVVAVELDEARFRQLMQEETPDDIEPSDLLHGHTVFQFLAYWMLSYVQNKMGDRFDMEPGADMRAAVETAQEHGHDVALVDRDIQTTIQRFWSRLTIREKLTLVGGLLVGAAEGPAIGVGLGVGFGAMLGAVAGLALAPLLGLADVAALGLAGTGYAGAVGGAVGGVLVGLLVAVGVVPTVSVGGQRLGIALRGGVGALAGLAVGGWLAITGTPLPLVGTPDFVGIGDAVLRGGVGAFAGGVVGGLLGYVLGAVGGPSEAEVDEAFEEFDLENVTDGDVVTAMMEEFRRFSPGGAEALIDERDAYIAHQLVGLRQQGRDVVAVVGAGHREGIERYLAAPETLPAMEEITGTESSRRFSIGKAVGYLVLVAFVSFFVLLMLGGARNVVLLQLFAAWFLFNGVFAFTAARLAGAKLTSAGVGGGVAWLTSINPLLAPGWFAGYVELRHRPVNVADIGRLNELLEDHERPIGDVVRDMLQVPLFRLIAVVAMTNVGSVIATFLFPFVVLPVLFGDVQGDQLDAMLIEGARNGAELLWNLVT